MPVTYVLQTFMPTGYWTKGIKRLSATPNPDFTGSFANRFTMGRFALDVLCTFKCGGDVYNYQRQTLESMTDTYNQTGAVMNRWRHEGR